MNQAPLLQVNHLRYAYEEREAVRDLSFSVYPGETLGFLGPNGAGKTTTLSCVCGLLRKWQGSMQFRGQEFAPGKSSKQRALLGVVPQELALYGDLTAQENLQFFGRLAGLRGDKLRQAVSRGLDLAGLSSRARDRVSTFSGGMKRRLNIAAGDLHSPELLLLDEPTAGVDPQSRNHIFETLMELKEEGRTLIYTTHYMEEAERLCNRILIVHEGALAASGSAQELAQSLDLPDANLEQVFLQLTGRSLRD